MKRTKIDYDKLDPEDVPMAKALDAMIDDGLKTVEKLTLMVEHLEGKKKPGFDKYLVIWDNPRRVEKCVIQSVNTAAVDLIKVQVINPEITRPIMFRKKDELFDTRQQVEAYLERMDMTAAH